MQNILEKIGEWLRAFLIECITENLTGLFDGVNDTVGNMAAEVGKTPQSWNAGVFSLIRSLSDNVVVPIAGIVLTFVLCHELIGMIMEKNNMHDFDTFGFFKWIFKAYAAVWFVTHTFDITMAVFELSQNVVNRSAGLITGTASVRFDDALGNLASRLEGMGNGELFRLTVESALIRLTLPALSVCVMLVLAGRMVEIYIYCSVGAIPFATMTNREWGADGEQLSARACRAGDAGIFHHGVPCRVFGTRGGDRQGGGHTCGDMGLRGVHGSLMFLAV